MSNPALHALPFTSGTPPLHHAHAKRFAFTESRRPPCTLREPSTYPILCPATEDLQYSCLTSGRFTSATVYFHDFLSLSADEQEEMLPMRQWFSSAAACKDFCGMYEDGSLITKYGECLRRECTDFEGFGEATVLNPADDFWGMACIGLGLMEMPEKMRKEMERAKKQEEEEKRDGEENGEQGEGGRGSLVDQTKEGKVEAARAEGKVVGSGEKVEKSSAGMVKVGWKGMAVAMVLAAGILGGSI